MRCQFPRTSHVVNGGLSGGGVSRDDLILSDEDTAAFFDLSPLPSSSGEGSAASAGSGCAYFVVAEEKVDGANLGIGLTPDGALLCQNRGHAVHHESGSQWAALRPFLGEHTAELCELFAGLAARHGGAPSDYILFGEWLVARHSIPYDTLPSPFLAFDLAKLVQAATRAADDLEFFDTVTRNCSLAEFAPSLCVVQQVFSAPLAAPAAAGGMELEGSGAKAARRAASEQLWASVHAAWQSAPRSAFSSKSKMEGVVIRVEERRQGGGGRLLRRCKAVADEFKSGIGEDGHWMGRKMEKNTVVHGYGSNNPQLQQQQSSTE